VNISEVIAGDLSVIVSWTKPSGNIKSITPDKKYSQDKVGGYVGYYWYADASNRSASTSLPENCGTNGINSISSATLSAPEIRDGQKSFSCLTDCDFATIGSNIAPIMTVKAEATASEIKFSNLKENQQIIFIVLYLDEVDNISAVKPECYSIIPTKTISLNHFYELEKNAKFKDAYCFIATAAYGSSEHSYVKTFRTFRDMYLKKFTLGKIFIKYYYLYSPPIAKTIENSTILKFIVRTILHPLYLMAKYLVNISSYLMFFYFIISLFFIISIVVAIYFIRKRNFHKYLFLILILGATLNDRYSLSASQEYPLFTFRKNSESSNYTLGGGIPRFTKLTQKIQYQDSKGTIKETKILNAFVGKTNALYQLEYEKYLYQLLGKWGIGISLGIFYDSGKSLAKKNNYYYSKKEDFKLKVFPVGIYGTYKLDLFTESYFTPFFNFGFQESVYFFNKGDTSYKGNRKGLFWTAGTWFNLDWIDEQNSSQSKIFYGLSNINIYISYNHFSNSIGLDGKEKEFDLSYTLLKFGFIFEFI